MSYNNIPNVRSTCKLTMDFKLNYCYMLTMSCHGKYLVIKILDWKLFEEELTR